ncbi:uncharacterized protein EDB93DRAFT_1251552 [Suillus bovinus]|uniref:uncharacterized protein n=1 Tax=Suillus bovinus TaxID=48563 RepID=UPI001B86317D|nr:uncharacterized protein EDB93DRAFT_1251552 [Suillus bovinus]KAG2144684.1 hypothetical protein EDB93DRAFT_1251552 [Suillus bovinus]
MHPGVLGHLREHLDTWAPTIFLLILLVSALASHPYPDLALVILVILTFPFALYLSLQQSQYIWPDPFSNKAYSCVTTWMVSVGDTQTELVSSTVEDVLGLAQG